jgi:CRP-like cAMP-binding protein
MNNALPNGLEQLGYGTAYQETLCELLESIPMFADLPRREVEVLARHMGAYAARPGTVVFPEGGRSPYLCFVATGMLEVLKEQREHDRRRLAVIRPGKAVGEMAFIDKQPHSASVVANTDTTLLLLTARGFEHLSEDSPRLALKLLWRLGELLSHRLRQTSGQLVDFL